MYTYLVWWFWQYVLTLWPRRPIPVYDGLACTTCVMPQHGLQCGLYHHTSLSMWPHVMAYLTYFGQYCRYEPVWPILWSAWSSLMACITYIMDYITADMVCCIYMAYILPCMTYVTTNMADVTVYTAYSSMPGSMLGPSFGPCGLTWSVLLWSGSPILWSVRPI